MSRTLLDVRDVSRRFGGVTAVNNVSLSLAQAELVSVIGPNGAGKSTLFNLITSLETLDHGQVHFDGAEITGVKPERLCALGLARTFQHGRVFGNLTVFDNVMIGAHTRLKATRQGLPFVGAVSELLRALCASAAIKREEAALRSEVAEILSFFGERLTPRIDHPAHSLSYANRRRVEIARALASHPRVLLLDEPTAGMNETETAEMLVLIQQLKARGLTILLIEHKLDMVMQLSDRVIVLDKGQKIAEGAPEVVRNEPRVIEAYLGHRHVGSNTPVSASADIVQTSGAGEASALADTSECEMSEAVLKLEHIDTFYSPVQVHFDYNLEVRKGQIVSLLGGNASGKSTTMKIVLGLHKPRAGTIRFNGEVINGLTTPQIVRRGIGSVPEARRFSVT